MTRLFPLVALVLLTGCYSQAAVNERTDDENCRKIIAERNDARPNAYDQCRAHLLAYRQADGQRTTVTINR